MMIMIRKLRIFIIYLNLQSILEKVFHQIGKYSKLLEYVEGLRFIRNEKTMIFQLFNGFM